MTAKENRRPHGRVKRYLRRQLRHAMRLLIRREAKGAA